MRTHVRARAAIGHWDHLCVLHRPLVEKAHILSGRSALRHAHGRRPLHPFLLEFEDGVPRARVDST